MTWLFGFSLNICLQKSEAFLLILFEWWIKSEAFLLDFLSGTDWLGPVTHFRDWNSTHHNYPSARTKPVWRRHWAIIIIIKRIKFWSAHLPHKVGAPRAGRFSYINTDNTKHTDTHTLTPHTHSRASDWQGDKHGCEKQFRNSRYWTGASQSWSINICCIWTRLRAI